MVSIESWGQHLVAIVSRQEFFHCGKDTQITWAFIVKKIHLNSAQTFQFWSRIDYNRLRTPIKNHGGDHTTTMILYLNRLWCKIYRRFFTVFKLKDMINQRVRSSASSAYNTAAALFFTARQLPRFCRHDNMNTEKC